MFHSSYIATPAKVARQVANPAMAPILTTLSTYMRYIHIEGEFLYKFENLGREVDR